MDLKSAVFSSHALEQMRERQITVEQVHAALARPEQVLPVRQGRVVAHAVVGDYLLRIFIDVDRRPPEVVTAYRTSKMNKYRSRP